MLIGGVTTISVYLIVALLWGLPLAVNVDRNPQI